MRCPKTSLLMVLLIALVWISHSRAVNFQIDLITHLNNSSALLVKNDTLFSATSGGLLVVNLSTNGREVFTSADGFYSHQFTAIESTSRGRYALGSITGILSIVDLRTRQVENDLSLKGHPVVEIVAVADTLWVLTRDLLAVYLYLPEAKRYQFIDFYDNFGEPVSDFYSLSIFRGNLWLGSNRGIFTAPADYVKNNLKAASTWQKISLAEEFQATEIHDILPEGDSLLFATNNGLIRYNFQDFSRMSSGLVNSKLLALRKQNGRLFAAGSKYVYEILNSQFIIKYRSPLANINDFFVDAQNRLWVAFEDRGILNVSDNVRILEDGPLDNYIGKIYKDSAGRLWCASEMVKDERKKGIFVRTAEGWQNFRFFGADHWRFLSSALKIMEDAGGNVWISSWGGGIAIFDQNLNPDFLVRNTVPGEMWRFSSTVDDTVEVQAQPQLQDKLYGVISDDRFVVVTDMMLDLRRQYIWILNAASLLNKPLVLLKADRWDDRALDAANWQYFEIPLGGAAGSTIYAVTQDLFGNLWIASERSGVFAMTIDDNGNIGWGLINESDNLKTNWCRAIAGDQDGFIWIGTRAGLNAYFNGDVFDFREDYQPIGLQINDIVVDSRNNKWIATDKGLSVLRASGSPWEKGSWVHIVPQFSELLGDNIFHVNLPSENIHSIFFDEEEGDVYLGTDAGIAILRNNPFASTFENYDQLEVGPNPFYVREGATGYVFFYNLVPGTEVKILSANGQLVRRLDPNNFNEMSGAQAQWDGRNEKGELVSSGVYLYLLTTEAGQNKAGKILVIHNPRQ